MAETASGDLESILLLEESNDEPSKHQGKTHCLESVINKVKSLSVVFSKKPNSDGVETISLLDGGKSTEDVDSNAGQRDYVKSFKGISSAFIYTFMWVASPVCVQLLQQRIPDMELNVARCVTPLILYIVGIVISRRWPTVERAHILCYFAYTVVVFIQSLCAFIAFKILPLASVQCTYFAATLVSGMALLYFFWSEKITINAVLSALLCLLGVVFVIQPGFIFKHDQTSMRGNASEYSAHVNGTVGDIVEYLTETSTTGLRVFGYFLATVSGISTAADILLVKRYPYLAEHFLGVLFWCFASGTVLSVILMLLIEKPVLPDTWFDITMVLLHSLIYALYWPFYMYAAATISGNTINNIYTSSTVFTLIAQYTVLSSIHPGHRNWIEVAGVVLVILGCTLSSIVQLFANKPNKIT